MAFFKFRRGGPQGNEGRGAVAAVPTESVEALRRRARHRLLGAAVLVLLGVIGFPLLFDTQPRPISVDIPIEIPDRTKAKPLALPTPPAPTATSAAKPDARPDAKADAKADARAEAAAASAANAAAPVGDGIITEAADGSEIPPSKLGTAESKSDPAPDGKPAVVAAPKPEAKPKPDTRTDTKPDTKTAAAKPAPKTDDGDRARALLEGKSVAVASAAAASSPASAGNAGSTASDDNGRFVIQVGAFADADKAREVRQKLEKAGLKTYTNVAKTADGERTRVRVGPFATRAEADRAAGKVKGLSLPASVLSL